MPDLEQERAELERTIADLRAFEADYRARMIAYHEECLRKLKAGEDVTGTPAPAGERREINCTSARTERRDSGDLTGVYQARGRRTGFSLSPRAAWDEAEHG